MPSRSPVNFPSAPTSSAAADRRDFYRIEDHIGLEIRRASGETMDEDSPFSDDPLESLRAELRRLDQDVRSQLASLAERDRLLASLIKSLNTKLDTLARIMAFEQNPLQPEHWQDVTLSEGGVAFRSNAGTWCVGELLAVRLTLPPELSQPQAIARVIDIVADDAGIESIHTEFTDIHDGDRQQIARHVMRWQIRQRQKE
ncbi:MAG: PilZ domain-containing protein [Pseudomonadota bacterium]